MSSYTFDGTCDVCGTRPILETTGMCAVCTFGEADSMWEWLWDFDEKDLTKAQAFIQETFADMGDEDGQIPGIMFVMLHIDDEVADRIGQVMRGKLRPSAKVTRSERTTILWYVLGTYLVGIIVFLMIIAFLTWSGRFIK